MGYYYYSTIFKALSDEIRLKIVDLLNNEGELCACKLLENFDITQPTLSYHMKILCDANIIFSTKKGPWMYYQVNYKNIDEARNYLDLRNRNKS